MKRSVSIIMLLFTILGTASGQTVSVSTNALDYIDGVALNAEASLALARHWTLVAGVRYSPFSFGSGPEEKFRKQRVCAAGVRFWPWHIYSGWWLGGKGQYQEYSSCDGRSPSTQEGDRYGMGLSAGYSKMLGKHFNLDIGLGAWAGYNTYVTYACQHCGRVAGEGARFFILPNDLTLALSYIF